MCKYSSSCCWCRGFGDLLRGGMPVLRICIVDSMIFRNGVMTRAGVVPKAMQRRMACFGLKLARPAAIESRSHTPGGTLVRDATRGAYTCLQWELVTRRVLGPFSTETTNTRSILRLATGRPRFVRKLAVAPVTWSAIVPPKAFPSAPAS